MTFVGILILSTLDPTNGCKIFFCFKIKRNILTPEVYHTPGLDRLNLAYTVTTMMMKKIKKTTYSKFVLS
jgi:hypothetical protein